jgi:acyl-CoA thioesterase FadM
MMRLILREHWMPVIGSAHVRYRRSLGPFERFQLTTRIAGWDEKWVFIEQEFTRPGGDLAAILWVRTAVRDKRGVVPPAVLLERLNLATESRPLPEPMAAWLAATSG